MTATGWVRTSVADFDAASATLLLEANHRVDADLGEGGGCIHALGFSLRLGTEGCDIGFLFERVYDYERSAITNHGALVRAEFRADSFCSGFSDEVEGEYYFDYSEVYSGVWFSGLMSMPHHDSTQSCASNVRIEFPDEQITLLRGFPVMDDLPITINLGELILEGEVFSEGSTDAECLQTVGGCATGHVQNENGMCSYI